MVPGSMLGVPAISLPVLRDEGLPLGLQLLGFADADAALFSTAGGVLAVLGRDERRMALRERQPNLRSREQALSENFARETFGRN